ncbi:DNA end-binding protein Ku [Nakamurella panacisegetis]|uniref:Non-homologous end joining protein Ku n=1 Tax=Nakamurella panacisegetis TaxID=1090615 RepID=A0A1H0SQ25_9ACTN|nr:Ku protein [Nakamurella panacisegetis]SDP43882.1 DNA end-binding protein Ku [Nakamurella panacisegetis]
MRSIWKGSLVFGLVNVPVAVYSATEDHDIKFHQVHEKDGGRIRYQRTCEIDGEVVPFSDIAKSYEAEDGRTAIITDEDLKSLPTSSEREIDLLSFVPAEQIDPVLYDASYLLEPASKSAKAYVLLRETLAENDRVAIVHFALRQKVRLAALRVRGDVLMLQTLRWPDEIREASFKSLETEVKLSPAEKQMAALLVDSYADDFHPEEHEDAYRAELQQMIDAKLEGEQAFPATPVAEGEDAEVLDLLAALQRSVARSKGEPAAQAPAEASDGSDDAPARKPRSRKPAAEKAEVAETAAKPKTTRARTGSAKTSTRAAKPKAEPSTKTA